MGVSAASNKKDKPVSRTSAPKLLRGDNRHPNAPVRIEFGQESTSITTLRTPAPLPPTPADGDVDGWFEQLPTNPSQIPDLGAMAGTGSEHDSMPGWNAAPRMSSVSGESPRHSSRIRVRSQADRTEVVRPVVMVSYSLLVLLAAVCLAVGMVLGALLQDRLGVSARPEPAPHSRAVDTAPGGR